MVDMIEYKIGSRMDWREPTRGERARKVEVLGIGSPGSNCATQIDANVHYKITVENDIIDSVVPISISDASQLTKRGKVRDENEALRLVALDAAARVASLLRDR